MIELLRRFLFDGEFFASRIRLLVFSLGSLLTTGVLSLDILSEKLGPAGWWVGLMLTMASVAIRSGDPTPEAAKNLAKADPVKLNALLTEVGAAPLSHKQQAVDENKVDAKP